MKEINMVKKPNILFISRSPLTMFSNVNLNLSNALINDFNVLFKHLSLNLGDELIFRLKILKEQFLSNSMFKNNISIKDYNYVTERNLDLITPHKPEKIFYVIDYDKHKSNSIL